MINILPKDKKKIILHEYWMRYISVSLVMLSIISIIATIFLLPSYFFSKSKEDLLEKELESFNYLNQNLEKNDLDKIIIETNNRARDLDNYWKKNFYLNEVIQKMLLIVPKGITFSQISYNETIQDSFVFEIRGKSINRNLLKELKTIMENDGSFTDIELPISNFVQKEDIDFIINFSLK